MKIALAVNLIRVTAAALLITVAIRSSDPGVTFGFAWVGLLLLSVHFEWGSDR